LASIVHRGNKKSEPACGRLVYEQMAVNLQGEPAMQRQLEETRQRVEETHASLTNKLETIEHDVREMIQGAN
jgi:hypothetical protein